MRLRHRAVDDDHRAGEHRRAQHAVHAELVDQRGLDRGQHHRQVFGLAAGHDGVDRDLLDRARRQVGRHQAEHLVGPARGALQHAQHPLGGRRHHRQAVGPAAVVAGLDRVFGVAEPIWREARPVSPKRTSSVFGDARLERLRAAARAQLGQPGAERGVAADALPVAAVPAVGALDLAAVLRRGSASARTRCPGGTTAPACRRATRRHAGGVGGVVLHDTRCSGGRPRQLAQQRLDQHAGRAVALGDDDQAVGQRWRGAAHGRSVAAARRSSGLMACMVTQHGAVFVATATRVGAATVGAVAELVQGEDLAGKAVFAFAPSASVHALAGRLPARGSAAPVLEPGSSIQAQP